MTTTVQHGFLVLADISGYTSYVATTELEHSQEILSDLLELIVTRLRQALIILKLEGDAVFAYAPESRLARGETLLELAEATYVAFRDRTDSMRRSTSCQCKACRAIPTLDLKFIVHYGDYALQSVGGIHELVGSDVNLLHRLTKNHVTEATGWRGYTLLTDQSLERVGVRPAGMHMQTEAYEHLGEARVWCLDLRSRYTELTDARRVFIEPEGADGVLTHDLAAPPPIVWDWLTDAQKRLLWAGGYLLPHLPPNGRSGVGLRNHCVHGKEVAIIETVLDWKPFDYFTAEYTKPKATKPDFTVTRQLEPLGEGTRLHQYVSLHLPLPRWARQLAFKKGVGQVLDEGSVNLRRIIAEGQEPESLLQVVVAAPS